MIGTSALAGGAYYTGAAWDSYSRVFLGSGEAEIATGSFLIVQIPLRVDCCSYGLISREFLFQDSPGASADFLGHRGLRRSVESVFGSTGLKED